MKLVTFLDGTTHCPGLVEGLEVVDLGSVAKSLLALVQSNASAGELRSRLGGARRHMLDSVRLLAPLPETRRNIFCIGKNYRAHAAEYSRSGLDTTNSEIPARPIVFTKAPTSIIGPGDAIDSSLDPTETLDYEGELAIVIGRGGRGIARASALAHVFGYTIVNDITARATQNAHGQWFLGKSTDTFCPMGPALVTADEIPEPARLRLRTRVNGEIRQDASVAELIFDIPTIIETISRGITLLPGDVIATGTPEGVGIGFKPPKFLRPGDRVDIEVDPVGVLSNVVR